MVGGSFILGIILVFGLGVGSVTNICGFGYPAFQSFKAIETKAKGDDAQWLVYWVIFALFNFMETIVDMILYWIPFYHAFKLAFLVWAMAPQTKGAKFLYDKFLKDLLKKNESRIDAALADAKKHAGTIGSEFANATTEVAGAAVAAATGKKDS